MEDSIASATTRCGEEEDSARALEMTGPKLEKLMV